MQKQVWPTDFLPKIYDHVINSLQIRKFGPYLNSPNMQVEWTKAANSKKINHVIKNFEEKVNGPNLFRHAYAVT